MSTILTQIIVGFAMSLSLNDNANSFHRELVNKSLMVSWLIHRLIYCKWQWLYISSVNICSRLVAYVPLISLPAVEIECPLGILPPCSNRVWEMCVSSTLKHCSQYSTASNLDYRFVTSYVFIRLFWNTLLRVNPSRLILEQLMLMRTCVDT